MKWKIDSCQKFIYDSLHQGPWHFHLVWCKFIVSTLHEEKVIFKKIAQVSKTFCYYLGIQGGWQNVLLYYRSDRNDPSVNRNGLIKYYILIELEQF